MDSPIAAEMPARFPNRVAGSDAERRAALALRDELAAAGGEPRIEPFRFHQRWALAQGIAAGLAVVGSVLSVTSPALGAALVAFAALSSIVEATGSLQLLARATGTRASQNVSAPPREASPNPSAIPSGAPGQRPGLLVVAAAYDAPRESLFGRLARRFGDPWLALGAALIAALVCCVLRVLDFEGDVLTALQLVPTLVLLAAIPLLVDVELSSPGDGVAEAAGAEVAIALAERLDGELERLDVWLVLCGAGGALGAGMRTWRRRHKRELSARPTVTVEVGAPEPAAVAQTVELYAELAHELDAGLANRPD